MTRWLFLPCSTRPDGNTLALARAAAAHLPAGAQAHWFDLATPPLPRFADLRARGGHVAPKGRLAELAAATLAADELVIVSPVYWYGLAGPGHEMLDHWSGWLEVPGMEFAGRMRGKRLWLVTVRADPAQGSQAPLEDAMRRSARWMGLRFGGALHGVGDAPGEVLADAEAMARARVFFTTPEA
ncbi:MAG: NAD(P)H-dependent oxidoreductase [Phaeovulum sp.]|uniref:NAD(P)H-dependent oxidoreductase n=2 Tax=Phaeovulum sp. TaxID=2934796 RepID=UPI002731575C|nr:NAD(P)H-dependent oxidoreductase [Phaeovulum sp.]MDP2062038.1 NAD(P)H-dependent oxidoreductase [Phaeovulum sp.]